MAREIPQVVRAAAGLAATVLDEVRKLPETLPGLPVRAVGMAMQTAMKVQQSYAGLVARGDEVFTGIRGEDEPGLATFDDELAPATSGFRDSAFDRAGGEQVEEARASIEVLADEAPATDEILDELALEELVGPTPVPTAPPPGDTLTTEDAAAVDSALRESEEAATREPTTDEPPAAEAPAAEAPAPQPLTSVTPVAAIVIAPVEGYDEFSIAQLRGRLRGYAPSTVQELLDYEQATRARDPYLTMLRNRLERLQADAT